MANWSAFTLTDKGLALQAKVNAGSTELKFTKFVIGSGVPSGTINAMTELAHKEMDVPINQISVEKNTVTMSGVITNTGVSVGFTLQEFGLNATDPDEGEILYGVMTDPNPDFIPAEGTATVVSQEFELHLTVSNTGNVSAVLDPAALVTKAMLDAHDANESAHQKAFEKHNKDEAAHPFLLKKITTDISTHNSATNAHLDIRQKITDDISAHNELSTAHPSMDFVKSLSSADDGLHYTMRNEDEDRVIDIVSVGDVAFRYKLAPGWVKANGATVKRSDYPRLVQFATDNGLFTSSPTSNPQLFGQGDGNTTFVLPDLRNRFIEGGDTVGVKSAGLPDIQGSITACRDSAKGAFTNTTPNRNSALGYDTSYVDMNTNDFKASRYNPIYGASTTVQPPAIVLIPQIKY